MSDDLDPPRKFYTMKAKEIERLNPAAGTHPKSGAIDVKDHLKEAANLQRPLAGPAAPAPRAAARPAPVAPPPPVPRPPAVPPAAPPVNEVQALVQSNAIRERSAGLHDVALDRPKRPSRRKRDYIITLVSGNAVILAMVAIAGANVISLMFGLGGLIVFNVAVTWIIWGVMDDY